MKIQTLTFTLIIVLASLFSVQAQSKRPNYTNGPTFEFCEAVQATPSAEAPKITYGFYRDRGLATAPCIDTWTIFLGNTITVREWSREKTFWYDWGADPNAMIKVMSWSQNMWTEPLTITYDPVTLVATKITSPSFPN